MANKQTKPSHKQLEVYFYLIQYVCKHGHQPSQREMAEALGVTQRSVVDRLAQLERKGLVRFPDVAKRDRSIQILRVRFLPQFDKTMAKIGEWMRPLLDEM